MYQWLLLLPSPEPSERTAITSIPPLKNKAKSGKPTLPVSRNILVLFYIWLCCILHIIYAYKLRAVTCSGNQIEAWVLYFLQHFSSCSTPRFRLCLIYFFMVLHQFCSCGMESSLQSSWLGGSYEVEHGSTNGRRTRCPCFLFVFLSVDRSEMLSLQSTESQEKIK